MVLTNDDIPEVVEGGESSGGPGAPPSPSDREPVQVTSWKPLETTSGLEIRGALVNTAKSTMAANISVRLEVKDEDDEIIGTAVAFLASDTLMPGSSTTFKAALSDVPDFAGEPIFYVESTALTMGGKNFAPGEQASSADDEGDDGERGVRFLRCGEDGSRIVREVGPGIDSDDASAVHARHASVEGEHGVRQHHRHVVAEEAQAERVRDLIRAAPDNDALDWMPQSVGERSDDSEVWA